MSLKLRPHQVEAVDAIVRGLDIPPGGVPAEGLRGQVNAACGTGKTIIAAAAAKRIAPKGRVLVLLPTLDLLAQTVTAWYAAGHTGPAVTVCSLNDDPELWDRDVQATTNPIQLAMRYGSGPVTIYATYASLPVLAEAFEGLYGQRLDPVDLAVVDEAHRTSGTMGKAWAQVHDQRVIPAVRRLYLTATPRIWQERPPNWQVAEGVRDPLPQEMAASMDDEAVFGPVLYKLSLASAVSRGLLARYQIIVCELQDPMVTPEVLSGEERSSEEVRGQRLAALQTALLRTMAEHELQTTITFHHRTIEAQAFAEGLPAVAAKLHADDPETYPQRMWADWLCGEHEAERRRRVLGSFGSTARRAVLSNCRVLGEGVDIRAVDSVALMDPKGAPHDIVQAIGRALRQQPGQGKLASLIVPVFLQPGEEPEDMFTSHSYRPLVKVLQGLRAHDEEAVELLAIPQEPQKNMVQPSTHIGDTPEEGEEESRLLLRFSAQRDPAMVAQWVSFNVIDTERQDWARGWSSLQQFVEREQHAHVPYGHREGAYPLGQWIAEQRRAYAAGQMPAPRAARLEQLGMIWDATDRRFQENLEAARAYYAQHWTLCAPRAATALDRPLGQWLSNLRRPGALKGHPEWDTALKAIDEHWNPTWPAAWQRHYAALRELVADEQELTGKGEGEEGRSPHTRDSSAVAGDGVGGRSGAQGGGVDNGTGDGAEGQQQLPRDTGDGSVHGATEAQQELPGGVGDAAADDPGEGAGDGAEGGGSALAWVVPGVTVHGMDIGRWLERQRQPAQWQGLMEEQRELLARLGVQPTSRAAATAGAGKRAEETSGGGAPATGSGKGTRDGTGAFERGIAALAQYKGRTGSVTVPRTHVEQLDDGSEVKLGVWLSNTKSRRGKLTDQQLATLADHGLGWAAA